MKQFHLKKKINVFVVGAICFLCSSMLMAQDCPTNAVDNGAAGFSYSFTVTDCADHAVGVATMTSDGGGAYISNTCNSDGMGTFTVTYATTNGTADQLANGGIIVSFSGVPGTCEYDAAGNLIEAEVPTLSEWGLLILALLFMTMGILYIINNKQLSMEQ